MSVKPPNKSETQIKNNKKQIKQKRKKEKKVLSISPSDPAINGIFFKQ